MRIYLYCAEHEPIRVVNELFDFGYDLHLLPNHFLTLEEAIGMITLFSPIFYSFHLSYFIN